MKFHRNNLGGLWLIFFICCKPLLFGQLHSTTEQDSSFILSLKHRPHLTFEFARRLQSIQIRNPLVETMLVQYDPNTSTNFMASFDYKWISLSLGLINFKATDSFRKGTTEQFSFRASFNGKRFWNTNFIQYYQGFYLANPVVADKSWDVLTDPYPYRPDINSFTLFSNLHYCFNPAKFSYRASLWQLDKQKKSAGSLISGVSYRLNVITSDTNQVLIPLSLENSFAPEYRFNAQSLSNFTIHLGYIHTFVFRRNWFLTLYFLPGISFQNANYQVRNQLPTTERSQTVGASEFRFILGYNADKWFTGLSSHSLTFTGNNRLQVWVDNNYTWTRLFIGYRFKQINKERIPKWMQKIGL